MYAIAYGQCSKGMRAKLESEVGFAEAAAKSNVIKLLKIIKKIPFHYQSQWYPYRTVHQAIWALYMTSQKEGMTLEQYLDEFLNRKEIVKQCGGNTAYHPGLVSNMPKEAGLNPDKPDTISSEDREEAKRDTKEAYLAWVFLSNSNKV
eukprot:12107255-Ditylum_brightwellii.AAC.1